MYGIGTMAGLFEAAEKLKKGRNEVVSSTTEQIEQKEDEETE